MPYISRSAALADKNSSPMMRPPCWCGDVNMFGIEESNAFVVCMGQKVKCYAPLLLKQARIPKRFIFIPNTFLKADSRGRDMETAISPDEAMAETQNGARSRTRARLSSSPPQPHLHRPASRCSEQRDTTTVRRHPTSATTLLYVRRRTGKCPGRRGNIGPKILAL